MEIAVTITLPDDIVEGIIEMLHNYPEAGGYATLKCYEWHYDECRYLFVDEEAANEETESGFDEFWVDRASLLKAIPLMFTSKWPRGLTQPPANADKETWEHFFCNSDAFDIDALVQLAIFGEVIYG